MVICYAQTPLQQFFLCRQCRTHIAHAEEYVCTDKADNLGVVNNVINVEVAGEAQYRVEDSHTLADIHCYICCTLLGQKIIAVSQENIVIKRAGRFLLDMTKLLMWDGDQMLHAHTLEAVENGA